MIEERIEQLQSELGKVQAELDELKAQLKKPEDRFVPKVGEKYWYVDDWGDINSCFWSNHTKDHFRLAVGNVHRTKEDARRYKASLFVKTPTGPCPKVGDMLYNCAHSSRKARWNSGELCIAGYEAELEAKWKRYGWSVTGEPEPEGWE